MLRPSERGAFAPGHFVPDPRGDALVERGVALCTEEPLQGDTLAARVSGGEGVVRGISPVPVGAS